MATRKSTGGRQTQAKSASGSGRKISAGKSGGGTKSRSGASAGRNEARSHSTTDHEEIRRWAEDRGAHPACVKGIGSKDDIGMLRLDFPGYSGKQSLQQISWDEFFEKFDERGLALLYQETTARGQKSNFNKIVSSETAEEKPKARGAH